jgi:RNA polymerase sigma-70 factor (ECF subfamily)
LDGLEKLLQIISGCATQDRKSQRALYDQYYGLCLKTVFRYVETYEQAVEVTNDGFVKIFRSFARFEIRDKEKIEIVLIGWMRRIMINCSIDFRRRQNHNLETSEILENSWDYEDKSQLPDSSIKYKELICLIRELPPAFQLVFNLHVIEGYSHAEIAKMIGIKVGTSKSNLFKARTHLQKKLGSEKNEIVLCQTQAVMT